VTRQGISCMIYVRIKVKYCHCCFKNADFQRLWQFLPIEKELWIFYAQTGAKEISS